MAEVGISVAAKVAEYFVDPAIQQLQYLFCVGKITRNFETRKEELKLKQRRVQQLVQEAINKTEEIDDEVKKWNTMVMSLIAEVENLGQELRADNGCFRRWCPTWRRYCLCRKLVKTTQRMTELYTKGDQLNPFSHFVIVTPRLRLKDFIFFESTKEASNRLLEALQDDGSSVIGLWGMGGSGKTSLVREVGEKAKELELFHRVVFTTISQTPNIKKIQDEIADFLGLTLEENSEIGRAGRIAMRLQKSDERILIILDDVWAQLNLDDIGNPFGGEGLRKCKVLLTTRRQEVCTRMDCQKTIPLHLLTEDEAWDLFQTHANVDDGIAEVAREVVNECKGLPIAIVVVAKFLKGKGLDEMKVALYKLKHAKPVHVDKDERDAFACLKLSYDYLETLEAKLMFLMCSMFPEDHQIVIEDLFRCGIGLGLCEDADSFELVRSQVKTAINVLIRSSLLIQSLNFKGEECVTMHDIVRDVALWIASEEHRTILVNHKELDEFLQNKAVKDYYAVSSWDNNKLLQFPYQLDAPKLEILLLNSSKSLDLSNEFFEGVKGLKVVVIFDTSFLYGRRKKLMSQSIQWLSNLRTLRLQAWDLGDISFVISLMSLEILDLQKSKFKRLPDGIENLSKLKLLDLLRCKTDECSFKVIGRCTRLEELYIYEFHGGDADCYKCLEGVPAFPKLRRFKLQGNMSSLLPPFFETSDEGVRVLSTLQQSSIFRSSAMIKDLAQRATEIAFSHLQGGYKSFIPDVVTAVGGMNELTALCIGRCSEIECLVDNTFPHRDVVVPRLVQLNVQHMDNLKQLCRAPQLLNRFPPDCYFGALKSLSISNCPMMTSLFPLFVSCTVLSLEEVHIFQCDELKHVIEGEGGVDAWKDSRFPKWKILSVSHCDRLESVCPIFCAKGFVQLQSLSIAKAAQMKFVFGEEQLVRDQNETQLVFPLLKDIELEHLPNLLEFAQKAIIQVGHL